MKKFIFIALLLITGFGQCPDESKADSICVDCEPLANEINTSVKAFGAACDGVTDDTAAIQAAIDAADGGVVFFPTGDCLISASLIIPSGKTLEGTTLDLHDTTGAARGSRITTASAIKMIDIFGTTGSSATNFERIVIKNLSLHGGDVATDGIRIWNARRIIIQNVLIHHCLNGILAGHTAASDVAYQIEIEDVHISSGATGITTTGTNDKVFMNVSNLEVRNMTGDGVNGKVTGIFSGGFYGAILGDAFDINATENLTLIGFDIENAVRDIYVHGATQNINIIGVDTSNSDVAYSRTKSIEIEQCNGGIIQGNQVSSSTDDDASYVGITLGSGADNMIVGANSFEGISGLKARYSIDSGADSSVNDENIARVGVLRGPNGAAATPTYSFYNSTNDGIFTFGAGAFSFALAGVERYRFTTTFLRIVDTGAGVQFGTDANPVKFSWVAGGSLRMYGADTQDACLTLDADKGDDNPDSFIMCSTAANIYTLTNHTTVLQTTTSTGEVNFVGIASETTHAVCIKSDGNLGTCSSVIAADGTCTCG